MPKARRVLVLPDAHYPHVDEMCEAVVIKASELLRQDETVILGDWAEMAAASSHPPSSWEEVNGIMQPLDELRMVDDAMKRIDRAAKRCKWVYLEGNHEQRLERWSISMGQHLGSDAHEALSPKSQIGKWTKLKWIPYRKQHSAAYRIAPDLIAVHGWRLGVYPAAAMLRDVKTASVVFGHCHRAQSHTVKDVDGRFITSWTPGCLRDLHPDWSPATDWVHGFSIVYVGRRDWTHYTIQIKPDGHCVLPDGKQVRV
jgi:UDP-2,3-diacylglucosamine pyrophosphatase LpxH